MDTVDVEKLKDFEIEMKLDMDISLKNWQYRSYKLKKKYFSNDGLIMIFGKEQIEIFENMLEIEKSGFPVDIIGMG